MLFGSRFDPWRANYALLKRAVDSAGRALARQPYEMFLQPGPELAFAEFFDGTEVRFTADVFRVDRDGTIWVSVRADADVSTLLNVKPTLVFRKLQDGSAFVEL